MLSFIVEKLTLSGHPLFVDESDYLTENRKMLETLRDIHDVSQVPVIMIGMNEIAGKLTIGCSVYPDTRIMVLTRFYKSSKYVSAPLFSKRHFPAYSSSAFAA